MKRAVFASMLVLLGATVAKAQFGGTGSTVRPGGGLNQVGGVGKRWIWRGCVSVFFRRKRVRRERFGGNVIARRTIQYRSAKHWVHWREQCRQLYWRQHNDWGWSAVRKS